MIALGGSLGLVVGGVQIFFLIVDTSWLSSNRLFVGTHAIYLSILLFMVFLLSEKPRETPLALPKVKLVNEQYLLTEKVNWMSIGTSVSIHLLEGEFEILKATGKVTNIQQNDLVQIELVEIAGTIADEISKNREKILVKPGMLQ